MKCPEITVADLEQWIKEKRAFLLVDVREPEEYAICRFPQTTHEIPMGRLQREGFELPEEHDIVVYCRSGKRSMYATLFLHSEGYQRVYNLKGGILEYIAQFKKDWTVY
ncbi:MAG: sulfurtransferase [Acidobacteria bacterium]|nr:MAG: sulfurtransferase [Acidobacteriota bacterium]